MSICHSPTNRAFSAAVSVLTYALAPRRPPSSPPKPPIRSSLSSGYWLRTRAISSETPLPEASSWAPGAPSTESMCAPTMTIGALVPSGSPTACRMPMTLVPIGFTYWLVVTRSVSGPLSRRPLIQVECALPPPITGMFGWAVVSVNDGGALLPVA